MKKIAPCYGTDTMEAFSVVLSFYSENFSDVNSKCLPTNPSNFIFNKKTKGLEI